MKKILSISLFAFLFLTICPRAIASNDINLDVSEKNKVNFESTTIPSKDLLTYDQMIDSLKNDGLSFIEINKIMKESSARSEEERPNYIYYRSHKVPLNVTSTYKPSLNFYMEVDAAHGAYYAKKLLNVSMNRSYNGISKQFAGTIYYYRQDKITFYYLVNGDFYNYGSTTFTGGGSIGIGGRGTLTGSVSTTKNHYKYAYIENTFTYGNVYSKWFLAYTIRKT